MYRRVQGRRCEGLIQWSEGTKELPLGPDSVLHPYLLPPMCISSIRLTLLIEIENRPHRHRSQSFSAALMLILAVLFLPHYFTLSAPLPTFFPLPPPRRCPSRHACLSPLSSRPPPTIVSRALKPSNGSFPELSLYAFRELLKFPSSAVLLGTLHGLTPVQGSRHLT